VTERLFAGVAELNQGHTGLALQELTGHAGCQLNHFKTFRHHVHHSQIGDDAVDHAHARQRQGAVFQDF